MKLFLIKIFKLGIIAYILLWLIQFTLDCGLKDSDDDLFYNWNKIYNGEINSDIIFFGSSRTLKHYNPKIFDKKLNVNSYNLGANGAAFDIQNIKYKAYFQNNENTNLVVLNVDIESLKKSVKLYNKAQYLPYFLLDNFNDFDKIDKNIIYEYLLPMYKYRGNYKLFGVSFKGLFGIEQNNLKTVKGFSVSNQSWNDEFKKRLEKLNGEKFNYSNFNLKNRIAFFESLLDGFSLSNKPILLVWAPEYIERQALEGEMLVQAKEEFKHIATKNTNIEFIDFTNDSICYDKYYFYDSYHLNNKGATKFSNMVSDSIVKYFKNSIKND
jgi:hypothetical protein